MWDLTLVILVVAIAAWYLIRRRIKASRREAAGCAGGCGSCPYGASASECSSGAVFHSLDPDETGEEKPRAEQGQPDGHDTPTRHGEENVCPDARDAANSGNQA